VLTIVYVKFSGKTKSWRHFDELHYEACTRLWWIEWDSTSNGSKFPSGSSVPCAFWLIFLFGFLHAVDCRKCVSCRPATRHCGDVGGRNGPLCLRERVPNLVWWVQRSTHGSRHVMWHQVCFCAVLNIFVVEKYICLSDSSRFYSCRMVSQVKTRPCKGLRYGGTLLARDESNARPQEVGDEASEEESFCDHGW